MVMTGCGPVVFGAGWTRTSDQTDCETEQSGRICKSVDDDLQVVLFVCHEGTVVGKQCLQDKLLEGLSSSRETAEVEEGSVKTVLYVGSGLSPHGAEPV